MRTVGKKELRLIHDLQKKKDMLYSLIQSRRDSTRNPNTMLSQNPQISNAVIKGRHFMQCFPMSLPTMRANANSKSPGNLFA